MSVSTKPATFPWESSLLSHYLNTGVLDNKQYHLTNFRKKKKKVSGERLSLFLSGGKLKKKKKKWKVLCPWAGQNFLAEGIVISILLCRQARKAGWEERAVLYQVVQ